MLNLKLLYLIILSLLLSCSQNSSETQKTIISDTNIIVLNELNVSNTSSGIVGFVDQQLGSFEQDATITQDIFVKNTIPSSVNFNASANDSTVTLDKTFCTAAANRGSCKFVATVKAGQTAGQQISSITINGQTLNYVLNVIPKVVPLPSLSYPNPMDLGSTLSAPLSKSFTVINQSLNTIAFVIDSSQTNSQFAISSNCTSVARNRGCPVNVTFTPTTPLVDGLVSSTFKLNGVTINVQSTVVVPTTPPPLPPVIPPVSTWDFGDIEQGKNKTLSISVTNRTDVSDTGPLSVVGLSNFSNPVISCPTSWARNRTCKITLTFDATEKNVQEYLETLTLKGSKIQLDLNLRANVILPSGIVPCTLANSPSYGVNVNNVATVTGNIPLCQVATCTDSNLYEVSPDQKSCVDKSLDCTLADAQSNGWNITNAQTPTGTKVGTNLTQCSVSTCNTNFELNTTNKTCDAISCTLVNASGNGVTSILNVATVSGTLPECSVSSCNANYKPTADSKSCIPKLCNELNSGELSTLGFNTTNATISGIYPSCSLSCSSGFGLASDGKSCLIETFEAVYSTMYTACSAESACDGVGTQSAPIVSCNRFLDGNLVGTVDISECELKPQQIEQSCNSPAGNFLSEILGGNLSYNCAEGQTTASITPTVICDEGYEADQINLMCIESIIGPLARLGANIGGIALSSSSVLSPPTSIINTMVAQPDGKILIAGTFSFFDRTERSNIVRINSDGTLDTTFQPSTTNNRIRTIKLQSDGKILIGGDFTSYNGVTRKGIARLNSDGSLDTSFNPGTGTGATVNIYSIAVQPDGKILFGGSFLYYFDSSFMVYRENLARVNSDGSHDATVNQTTGPIYSMVVQPDGKILLGNANVVYGGSPGKGIVRLNSNGTVDSSFSVSTGVTSNTSVFAIALESDGKILIGGSFTSYNGVTRNGIARITTNGGLDTSFNPGTGVNNFVYTISLQSDGKILIGGNFTQFNGALNNYVTRLNNNGTMDSNFNSGIGANKDVYASVIKSDGKILIGGDFTSYNGIARNYISSLNSDGSLDNSETSAFFASRNGANNTVNQILLQSNGKILLSGEFTSYNGASRNRLVRLNSSGFVDLLFNPGAGIGYSTTPRVNSIGLQTDGKVLIVGEFTSYSGTSINRIARLNSDGSLDTSFNIGSGTTAEIFKVIIQTDGKILIGGSFTSYNGTSRNRIARLNSDGSLDTSFNPGLGASSTVRDIIVQSDGKILIGGDFTTYNSIARNRIARLNSDGSLDTSFVIGNGASAIVRKIIAQSDGKILIGGDFTTYNSIARNRIARLNSDGSLDTSFVIGTGTSGTVYDIAIQTDGKILIGGSFSLYNGTSINDVVRVSTEGTLDTSFNIGTGIFGDVRAIAIQSNGKIIMGGRFSAYNGEAFDRIIRVNSEGVTED